MSFNNKEELNEYVNKKIESSQLFQQLLDDSAKYPCGILVRNGNKKTYLSAKNFEIFLEKSKNILNKNAFPCLYKEDGAYVLREHGGGFLIPVEKSLNVETLIHSLKNIAEINNLCLRIEKSKDGPCEDGRNTITEWKLLPPGVTVENAERLFSGFGTVKSVERNKKSFFITFSYLTDTLPLCSITNIHTYGSSWFVVFKNRSVICRFTSSLSCSKCHIKGHHHSRCPNGLSEKVSQYRQFVLNKTIPATITNERNQPINSSIDDVGTPGVIENKKEAQVLNNEGKSSGCKRNNSPLSKIRKDSFKKDSYMGSSNLKGSSSSKSSNSKADSADKKQKGSSNSKQKGSKVNSVKHDKKIKKVKNISSVNCSIPLNAPISFISDSNFLSSLNKFDKEFDMIDENN